MTGRPPARRAALSREHRASRMSSTGIGREQPGGLRKAGAASIAHASDAHEARIARFSLRVRSGSLTTSRGCENAPAGCKRSSSSRSNGLFGELGNEGFFIATSSVEHMDTKRRRMPPSNGLSFQGWRAMMWFNKNQFSRVNKFGTAVERIGLGFRVAGPLSECRTSLRRN